MRNVLVTSKYTPYITSVLLVDCIVCEAFDLKNNFGEIYIYMHWTKDSNEKEENGKKRWTKWCNEELRHEQPEYNNNITPTLNSNT